MNKTEIRAIGYIRIANKKVNPELLTYSSTINQIEGIVKSAMFMGIDLKAIDISNKSDTPDNLDKLLYKLKKLNAKYLVVKSLDRLSRDPYKLCEFFKQLEIFSIELIVADEIFI